MDIDINYLAVVVATIMAMLIGGIWYAKAVFGGPWMKLVSLDEEKATKQMPITMMTMLVGAFIKAWTLAYIVSLASDFYEDSSFFQNALVSALAIWFGFIVVHVITVNMFELRPFKLSLINLGNELVTMLAMGAIIGAFGV